MTTQPPPTMAAHDRHVDIAVQKQPDKAKEYSSTTPPTPFVSSQQETPRRAHPLTVRQADVVKTLKAMWSTDGSYGNPCMLLAVRAGILADEAPYSARTKALSPPI